MKIDREKVINGLKCHAEHNCDGCPYYGKNQFDVSLCPTIITDAIELLKEQQAQIDKLIEESASNAEMAEGMKELLKDRETVKPYIDIDEAKCPVCKVRLTRQELLGDDVLFEDFYDYCPRCGRRVVWDE